MPEFISRGAARRLRLARYFVDSECHAGHRSERYVSNAVCMACERANRRKRANFARAMRARCEEVVSEPAEVVEKMVDQAFRASFDVTAALMGDPEPGRSALAMRGEKHHG